MTPEALLDIVERCDEVIAERREAAACYAEDASAEGAAERLDRANLALEIHAESQFRLLVSELGDRLRSYEEEETRVADAIELKRSELRSAIMSYHGEGVCPYCSLINEAVQRAIGDPDTHFAACPYKPVSVASMKLDRAMAVVEAAIECIKPLTTVGYGRTAPLFNVLVAQGFISESGPKT